MKKIILTILLIFMLQTKSLAQTGLSFIYINGSNNNDKKMQNWYESGVKKLHPCLKSAFESNVQSQKYFLNSGEYKIEENPVIFFWGDKSHRDLAYVESELAITKGFSPWLAYTIRAALTHFLHDAIWVSKYHNMLPVLEDLQASVKNEAAKGNKVVLYGYSAGSFITYEYLLTRLPYINLKEYYRVANVSTEIRKFVDENPRNDTCMSALGQDLAVFSATGHVVPNDDFNKFKEDYLKLDSVTEKFCAPKDSVRGVVNFASPLVLFYSDLSDPNFQLTYYNRLLFKYLFEHDMFWLTVNYREDPLGFPCGKNLTISEIEKLTDLNIGPHKGFIYDQSNTKGAKMVFTAHTSYWKTRKNFSKAVVDAYVKGYLHVNEIGDKNKYYTATKKLRYLP